MTKQQIINKIIRREGGFTDNPADSGGPTNFGITESVAREHGFNGDMSDLPWEIAFGIYATTYWDSVRADDMQLLSMAITDEVVDTGVNMGVGRAGQFLQRSLNALNDGGRIYGDLKVDGQIGPATLRALQDYLDSRDEMTLLVAMNCLQGAFYIELSQKREKDEAFVYGWLKNRVTL